MISSKTEYQKAREELDYLGRWLSRLEDENAPARKGLTTAGVRRMISRLQDELAEYEATGALIPPGPGEKPEPDKGDAG